MKIDKHLKGLSDRLNAAAASIKFNNLLQSATTKDSDDYYLATDSEPPRFQYYRHVRIQNSNDEWKKKTFQAAYDSITQDELDFYLKRKLREPPEQRYLREKGNWFFHDSSYSMRGLDAYDGEGCNGFTGCIPECRYYPDKGRIEDEEVIREHKRLEAEDKKQNMIVNIDLPDD